MSPKVADITVGIPTLDRAADLARCLDAVLAGDVLPYEVVIVDQSADDRTQRVVEARRSTTPVPIAYIPRDRRSASAARNTAVERAARRIVAFTDDDCVPSPSWLSAIELAFASRSAPDVVTGRVLPLGPDGPGLFGVSIRDSPTRRDFAGKQIPWLLATGGNFSVRRESLDRAGFFDERLGPGSPGRAAEDADLFYRLLRAGARFRYEPDALVYHPWQSSSQRTARTWEYAFGIGAVCGLRLREADLFAARILGFWFRGLCVQLVGALLHGNWFTAYQRVLSLLATAPGLVYGLTVR